MIDLQAVVDHCYDMGPYAREVSYQADTPVPAAASRSGGMGEGSIATHATRTGRVGRALGDHT